MSKEFKSRFVTLSIISFVFFGASMPVMSVVETSDDTSEKTEEGRVAE
ncbi:MAG: hypothetical protein J5802_11720 [Butyrivibrio sp.]|nr:hypothetical protein [Butyrivibrio sp.]